MTWLNRTMLLAAVAGLLLSLAPPSALAQDDEPGWVNVRVIEVKPDRVAEWEQLHKQRNEAFKKAGRTVPEKGGMHFTPGYPISCGWLIRRPRTCCTISE